MLYSLIRPWLFAMEPEVAHQKALDLLQKTAFLRSAVKLDSHQTEVMGITFPNRVGLAAGLDKNGEYLTALGKLGFGFIEIGTVTPEPQSGNPQPRLFRLTEEKAIINRMGFNNVGVEQLVKNVKKANYQGVLGINIGKNKTTPNELAVTDYLYCMEQVYEYADYITINISSPNTPGLRDLQGEDELKQLLEMLKEVQVLLQPTYGYKPLVVKIAPDLSNEHLINTAKTLQSAGIDGVIAGNTTIHKDSVASSPYANEEGGLSGAPLHERSTHVIRTLASELGKDVPVIGVGGIMSAEDAQEKIDAGAALVQLYTGLIYQGPSLVKQLYRAGL